MKTKLSWFDRIMAAVTFAEANEAAKGRTFLSGPDETVDRKAAARKSGVVLTTDLQGAEARS